MTISYDLNSKQLEAVNTTEGPVMVIAGAGSGKTSVLTRRICKLISIGVPSGSILAITFTNKAAQEMKDRVENMVGPYAKYMWISTFHSACVRILKEDAHLLGYNKNFTIYDTSDSKRVIDRIIKSMGLDTKRFDSRALRSAISNAKALLMSPDLMNSTYSGFSNRIGEIYSEYQSQLKKNNAMDFDDLLVNVIKILSEFPDTKVKWNSRFNYVLVDEYQDTNHAQSVLIKHLVNENKNIFIVGDFDQSIYRFRGAEPTNFLEFEKMFENPKVIVLDQNYRSYQNILDGANAVIKNNFSKQTKHLHSDFGSGEKINVVTVEDEASEANFVAREISRLHLNKVDYSEIAVMYRTNGQSRVLESVLNAENIPYKVIGGLRFFDRKEIKDALGYLRVVINQNDGVSIERTLNTPRRSIGPKAIAAITDFSNKNSMTLFDSIVNADLITIGNKAQAGCREYANIIKELQELYFNGEPPVEIVQKMFMLTNLKLAYELDRSVEAEGKLENLDELLNLASEYETLDEMLDSTSLSTEGDETGGINMVSLMTLHAAKGLEFDSVFLVGMEEGLLPHIRSVESPDNLEEERRLCYVGITRAKRNLYLISADLRSQWGSVSLNISSRFIDEIPSKIKKVTDLTSKRISGTFRDSGNYPKRSSGRWDNADQLDFENYAKEVNNATKTRYKTTGAENLGLKVGDVVVHTRWGEGTVISVSGAGNDARAIIRFVTGTQKTFLLSMTPLKRA